MQAIGQGGQVGRVENAIVVAVKPHTVAQRIGARKRRRHIDRRDDATEPTRTSQRPPRDLLHVDVEVDAIEQGARDARVVAGDGAIVAAAVDVIEHGGAPALNVRDVMARAGISRTAFYREFAGQGPRKDFEGTTQGFYVATAGGELLLYNNNRNPAKLLRLMKQHLRELETRATSPTVVGAPSR